MIKKIVNKFKGNLFVYNTIWNIGGKVLQMGLSLIVGMLTARYLGPSNYGVIGYTASFVSFFTVICQLGLTSVAVKELIDHKETEGEVLGTTIFLRICTSIISTIAITIMIYFIDDGDKVTVWVAFLQSLSLIFQSFEMFHYWYQSRMETQVSVKVQTAAYLVMSAYKIILLILGMSVQWFAFSTALEAAAVALFLYIAYRKKGTQKLSVSLAYGKKLLGESYHFILSGLMVTIYSEMDKIMLKQMLSSEATGYYVAANKVSSLWSFVLMALISSAQPLIIAARNKDYDQYIKKNKQLYAAVIWIGAAAGLAVTILGRWIILIMYGETYLAATSSLQISAWYTLFAMLGSARGTWIVCENKGKYVKYYLGVGAVVNIILNYLLIPVYGPAGAAAATLLTQIFTAVFAPALFKETRIYTKYVFEAFLLKEIR